ncbi:MAG: MlaD family protein [Bacteroidia bacterium]
MEKDTRRKILLGVFAFIGAALFLVAIFLAGRKENLFEKSFTLSAIFNDVNGIKKGNYVYYSGVRGGIVKKVTFINDSMILVDMSMEKSMQKLIKKDAKVFISTEGLVGDKIIQIKPTYRSRTPVKDFDTLVAINPYDTHDIIEKLISTNDHAAIISSNLAELSEKINQPHKGLASALLNDSSIAGNFADILQSLKTTGKQMSALSFRLEKITDNISSNNSVVGGLLSDSSALKNDITNAINNLVKVSDYSMKITQNINSALENSRNNNAVGVLVRDSVFAKDLKEGMENFRNSTKKLDQNMEALQHSFLFRKFFSKRKPN